MVETEYMDPDLQGLFTIVSTVNLKIHPIWPLLRKSKDPDN